MYLLLLFLVLRIMRDRKRKKRSSLGFLNGTASKTWTVRWTVKHILFLSRKLQGHPVFPDSYLKWICWKGNLFCYFLLFFPLNSTRFPFPTAVFLVRGHERISPESFVQKILVDPPHRPPQGPLQPGFPVFPDSALHSGSFKDPGWYDEVFIQAILHHLNT